MKNNGVMAVASRRIGFLGSFTIDGEDGTRLITAPKQRTVLVALAERAGKGVKHQVLIDATWETPPENPEQTLRTYIARLRKLDFDIETYEQGYELVLSPCDVDMNAFRRLIEEAKPLAAAGQWKELHAKATEALSLWPEAAPAPLDGIPPCPLKDRLAAALDEEWRLVKQYQLDAELRLGLHREAVPDLSALTARYPLDEEFRMLHMRALNLSHRRADAIAVYHTTRQALDEQLGVTPSPALSALYQEIIQ